MKNSQGLYIALFSVHGLIKNGDLELGRDPDTGGQVLYVVELARALAEDPRVDRVDLFTRQVVGKQIDPCYAQEEEDLAPGARIIRIPCGPRRYLRKESLWPYLDAFVDGAVSKFQHFKRVPDIVHGHYADAGQAGAQIARLLGVPFVFTGHSLGRVKQQRLEEKKAPASSYAKFAFEKRFEAEESALDTAALVVTSTQQEVDDQYAMYDHYNPDHMQVIPPGVNLNRFSPLPADAPLPAFKKEIDRFLHHPDKPIILAMARPDERKNFDTLIRAYAENPALREAANLVLITGNRTNIQDLDKGSRRVMVQILNLIDSYDLYGSVAYPKQHCADDVPTIYQIAARSRGIFVNPAWTEPFGLTLIEAAASGLPIVATNDGGPRDIIQSCQNGCLINPMDAEEIGNTLLEAVGNREQWAHWSASGIAGALAHYSWTSHATRYLDRVTEILNQSQPPDLSRPVSKTRISQADRVLVTDIDNTLLGDEDSLLELLKAIEDQGDRLAFAVATGRNIDHAIQGLKEHHIPIPDIMITSVGTEIYYRAERIPDLSWQRKIQYMWDPTRIREVLGELPGLELQQERPFNLSYIWNAEEAPRLAQIKRTLRNHNLHAKVVSSLSMFIDVVPIRAGDGLAIRHLGLKWGIPPQRWLVAGDSGNDEDMLRGNTLGVVVGNYSKELNKLRKVPWVYFADAHHAGGILEGINHYQFFDEIQTPSAEEAAE